eukprot:m.38329 g.38329  ORF g.38329 m.38329 type:complete len:333 (-) comp13377_c0_seq1:412-1410(-)
MSRLSALVVLACAFPLLCLAKKGGHCADHVPVREGPHWGRNPYLHHHVLERGASSQQRAATAGAAGETLRRHGVVVIEPGAVDGRTVAAIDEWVADAAASNSLHQHPIRAPQHRLHGMVLPGDANGLVAHAVAKIATAVGLDFSGVGLAELGVFVVGFGADAQDRHADRETAGFISCQLALHDMVANSGGLGVWPWETRGVGGNQTWVAAAVEVAVAPLVAGQVVCYDGRLHHRGQQHRTQDQPTRRVLYFTAATTAAASRLGEVALHPRLRCVPVRDAPLLPLGLLVATSLAPDNQSVTTTRHNSWYSNRVCEAATARHRGDAEDAAWWAD